MLYIGPLGTTFSEILIKIHIFPFMKIHLKMSFGKWWLRADSRLAPSQWETSLQSNIISHWLGANLVSALVAVLSWSQCVKDVYYMLLHFTSFCHPEMAQEDQILTHGRQGPIYPATTTLMRSWLSGDTRLYEHGMDFCYALLMFGKSTHIPQVYLTSTRAQFQYPKRCLIIRSCEVLKLPDW